ncbi:PorP/SprF family type IX secretion system membrane protein [Yeosuana sp. AK3]
MKKYLLHMVLFFCFMQQVYSQENGVVALNLPVRNSLKFNRYVINPTFSFVREQNKYVSFSNKREWVQFNDAPQTYLFSYSGRFNENTGAGIGLFQQNYGVLTTFGGVLNFAYNAVLDRDQNLTFGMNLGFYKSGINEGNVITNFPDPSLNDIPSNAIITINPGINYGTTFLDFGVSLNNLVSYNLNTSKIIEENPEQSLQAHIMYTGYLESRGFFDESKFSGLVRSEFKRDKTIISGILMLSIPKGMWVQAGYNSLYGASGGIGFNISNQIAMEYNYEKAIGDLLPFGSSHEFTLAYKFKKNYRYNYSDYEEEGALIQPAKKGNRTVAKRNNSGKTDEYFRANRIEKAKQVAEEKARVEEVARIKKEQEAIASATEKTQTNTEGQETAVNKEEANAQSKAEEDARIKLEQENLAKQAAEEKTKTETAQRIKLEQVAKAKAEEEAKIKLEQENKAKQAAEEKAKAETAAKIKLEQAAKAKAEEEARIKLEQENQAKQFEEAQAKADLEELTKAKAEEEARIKLVQENQAKQIEEAQTKADIKKTAKVADKESEIISEELDGVLIPVANDETSKSMESLTKLTADTKIEQQDLLKKLGETIVNKEIDLKDLKEENDLSEQGIYKEPKPFKSVSVENAALESLKLDIESSINAQNQKISQLESLYSERLKNVPNKKDSINSFYFNAIERLKSEQQQTINDKNSLFEALENIQVATEIERKRRIKRAAYDNEEDRYLKDRAILNLIKQNTPISNVALTENDFDFGEEQTNIQIVKSVKNEESGYYLVVAVHTDVEKRDEFLRKTVSVGQTNINFFYDVNSSKYFIYYEKFDDIESASKALESNKANEPYNAKMSMVKIEN